MHPNGSSEDLLHPVKNAVHIKLNHCLTLLPISHCSMLPAMMSGTPQEHACVAKRGPLGNANARCSCQVFNTMAAHSCIVQQAVQQLSKLVYLLTSIFAKTPLCLQ